jgi:hypothetical protein
MSCTNSKNSSAKHAERSLARCFVKKMALAIALAITSATAGRRDERIEVVTTIMSCGFADVNALTPWNGVSAVYLRATNQPQKMKLRSATFFTYVGEGSRDSFDFSLGFRIFFF